MKRRVFLSIPIEEDIKKEIRYEIDRMPQEIYSFGRIIKEENWHVTLKFLGDRDDDEIEKIIKSAKETALEVKEINKIIKLTKITLDKIENPRMIWVFGDKKTSENLGKIQKKLEENLLKLNLKFEREKNHFFTHITIARFFKNFPRNININEDVDFSFNFDSFDLMESKLEKSGAIYKNIQKISIK